MLLQKRIQHFVPIFHVIISNYVTALWVCVAMSMIRRAALRVF